MNSKINLKIDTSAVYRIKVQGRLKRNYAGSMNDMQISYETSDNDMNQTLIIGKVEDQAALSGVLNFLYDMQMPVLSVECLEKL